MGLYTTHATGHFDQMNLEITALDKPNIISSPPPEFNGPKDLWSPEDLFCASISSCFILTAKALARARKLDWITLEVTTEAKLEKVEGGLKFTDVTVSPTLSICCTQNADPYLELLYKAKESCLVARSINCNFILKPKIHLKAKA